MASFCTTNLGENDILHGGILEGGASQYAGEVSLPGTAPKIDGACLSGSNICMFGQKILISNLVYWDYCCIFVVGGFLILRVMTKELYRVKYRIEGPASATNASATVMLYSASESEAINELKKRGTIGRDKTVIILSIERC